MNYIVPILKRRGPMLSGELLAILVSKHGLTEGAARQRLRRAKSPVHKLRGLFQKNQSFVYLQEDYNSERYYLSLYQALEVAAFRYFVLLNALNLNFGSMPMRELANYSISPVEKLKGHQTFKTVLEKAREFGMVFEPERGTIEISGAFSTGKSWSRQRGFDLAKKVIMLQFEDWAKKTNLISFKTGKRNAEFGKFQWAFTGSSYLLPLRGIKTDKSVKSGFLLADVVLGREIDRPDTKFAIQKVEVLKGMKGIPTFLPVLLVESLSKDALKELRAKGFVVGFIDKILGEENLEMLKHLVNTVENAGAILKKNPEQFLDVLTKLNKLIEGQTGNLKGDLFELAVGYYHGQRCQSLDIGKRISAQYGRKEIDVFATYDGKCILAECKGYSKPMGIKEVKSWREKHKLLRDWFLNQHAFAKKRLTFELWCAGGFTSEAESFLQEAKGKTSKYDLQYYGGQAVREKARELESTKFLEILNEYFFEGKTVAPF